MQCTMGGHPDIGESSSFERDLNGKKLDTKLVMNHCSFTFVTMENLKNEAPQEVKYDEKSIDFWLVQSFMEILPHFLYN